MMRMAMMIGAGLGLASMAQAQPVVLELFTSQGCSSCPPAEALVQQISAQDPDVLTLAYHVDYWDNLGWADPLANPQSTQRQRDYSVSNSGRVFTPEVRVNGLASVVGSNAVSLQTAIGQAPALLPAKVTKTSEGWSLALPASAPVKAQIMLLTVVDSAHTNVKRGENAGAQMLEQHIVKQSQSIGSWDGKAVDIRIPQQTLATGEYSVVLVQAKGPGQIMAAARLM